MLPDWLSPEVLRWLVLGFVGVVLVGMYFVIRIIQKVVLRVGLVLVLGIVAVIAWNERADLEGCAQSCTCELLGREVSVPACRDSLNNWVNNTVNNTVNASVNS
ncbi:MAG: hypothetical protein GY929_12670 [Actinomycetia bacterium]|nr:hypothetical protein [Actinomycetes bacterium]